MTRRDFVLSAAACAAGAASAGEAEPPEPLRAGAHAIDITPEKFPVIVNGMFQQRRTNRAHDRLHARCLVLAAGEMRLAIVVVDSCLIPRELLDEAKALAAKATGIAPENMLISATHTHSAPAAVGALGCPADPDYPAFLVRKIADGIAQAAANLAPARVGHAVVDAAQYTNCRRWILRPDKVRGDPFGQRTVRAHMHPGYQNGDFVGPSGPIDPAMTVLGLQSPAGRPIALLANFSMHYFGSGMLSADYYGAFCKKVAKSLSPEETDPAFVGIMAQGTSGDLHWMDYSRPKKAVRMADYAAGLAKLACQAYRTMAFRGRVPLAMREAKLALHVREPDADRLAWARKIVAELAAGKKPGMFQQIYSREAIHLHDKPVHELKLQAIRIGEVGIAAIPCEVYGLTGLRIKAASPLPCTMNFGLANGADGYIPPPAQHALGGYTTWPARSACLEVQAERKIVQEVLGLLEGVSGKPRRRVRAAHGAYARAVLASRPVACWPLADMTTPRAAGAVGGHAGRYEPGVAVYLPGPALPGLAGKGRGSRAAHFAGGRLAAKLDGLGGTYSVELWFYNALPVTVRPVTGYLLSRGPDGGKGAPGDHLGIGGTHEKQATGRLLFFNGDQADNLVVGTAKVQLRTWTHLALVRQGRKVAVYLNGAPSPDLVGELPAPQPTCPELFVGGRSDGFANFEGRIAEVAVFDRVLTAAEIATHHAAAGRT